MSSFMEGVLDEVKFILRKKAQYSALVNLRDLTRHYTTQQRENVTAEQVRQAELKYRKMMKQ